jgi:hypothetical protein
MDRAICEKETNSNHELFNIIDLCYNCHYNLFDVGKMGIRKIDGKDYFFIINNYNEIEKIQSQYVINVLEEYIRWKNLKCRPKLWKSLFN